MGQELWTKDPGLLHLEFSWFTFFSALVFSEVSVEMAYLRYPNQNRGGRKSATCLIRWVLITSKIKWPFDGLGSGRISSGRSGMALWNPTKCSELQRQREEGMGRN